LPDDCCRSPRFRCCRGRQFNIKAIEVDAADVNITVEASSPTSGGGESIGTSVQTTSKAGTNTSRSDSAWPTDELAPLPVSNPGFHTMAVKKKIRTIMVWKIALGVIACSLLVLLNVIDDFLMGTGAWAIITLAIATQPTPGATMQKCVNRVLGTVIAAGLAVLIGYGCAELDKIAHPAGDVLIGASVFGVTLGTMWLATDPKWAQWAYAYMLGGVTYCFLALDAFHLELEPSAFRAGVIAATAIFVIGCAWLPPRVLASELATAYLADHLTDIAAALDAAVALFLEGARLHAREAIYADPAKDDAVHRPKVHVLVSREALQEAVKAAGWEMLPRVTAGRLRAPPNPAVAGYIVCGRHVRAIAGLVHGLEDVLRLGVAPLHASVAIEAALGAALRRVALAVMGLNDAMIAQLDKGTRTADGKRPPSDADVASLAELREAQEALREASHVYARCGPPLGEGSNDAHRGAIKCMEKYGASMTFAHLVLQAAAEAERAHASLVGEGKCGEE